MQYTGGMFARCAGDVCVLLKLPSCELPGGMIKTFMSGASTSARRKEDAGNRFRFSCVFFPMRQRCVLRQSGTGLRLEDSDCLECQSEMWTSHSNNARSSRTRFSVLRILVFQLDEFLLSSIQILAYHPHSFCIFIQANFESLSIQISSSP